MTIVAIGLPYWKGENLGQKVTKLINIIKDNPPAGGDRHLAETNIVNFLCMPERSDGRHPLVKIQFENTNHKISILHGKQMLKNTREYKHVFLRTSKTRTKLVMEQNVLALLKMIPDGEKLKLSRN